MNFEGNSDYLYTILNSKREDKPQKIKENYFYLSKIFHPDKQPSETMVIASEYFSRLEEAYKVLTDPLKRYIYDNYGDYGLELYE